MRICVTLQVDRETVVPLNYQHFLTGIVYRFLQDADYASFLHDKGYSVPKEDPAAAGYPANRRFKLFTFSQLRAEDSRLDLRDESNPQLRLRPGSVTWQVTSPVIKFITEFATGLLSAGALRIGGACLPIAEVKTLATPEFTPTTRFH